MEIVQVVAIAVVASAFAVIFKKRNPEYALYMGIVTGLVILYIVLDHLQYVFSVFTDLANKMNLDQIYLKIIFKILGISYISELGAQLCKDADQFALGFKIEFAGKILIFVVSIPIIMALIELLMKMLT